MRHNWKTRWFKLSDSSLRYYKSKSDKVPQGRIPLTKAKLSIYQCDHKSDKDREVYGRDKCSIPDFCEANSQATSLNKIKLVVAPKQDVYRVIGHIGSLHGSNSRSSLISITKCK